MQPRTKHHVQITTKGVDGTVMVDGIDISAAVRAVNLDAAVGNHTRVTLELLIVDITQLDSKDTELLIPDATAEALVALGWTPPESEQRT